MVVRAMAEETKVDGAKDSEAKQKEKVKEKMGAKGVLGKVERILGEKEKGSTNKWDIPGEAKEGRKVTKEKGKGDIRGHVGGADRWATNQMNAHK